MGGTSSIRFEVDGYGIGVARIDMPGRAFNVFSDELIDELEALIGRIESAANVRGVVFASGKDAFMAGADLAMVSGFANLRLHAPADAIRQRFARLTYLLRRLELLPIPTVAAINGLALGGGLELAMACHHRVAVEGTLPCLGLPEIRLGLLPGAGGTQRLPRLTKPSFAARMLMDGRPVTPAVAHAAGLVDHLAAADVLVDSACALARHARAGARWDDASWSHANDDLLQGADAVARLCELAWVDRAVVHLYPAFAAIARCLTEGYAKAIDRALEVEIGEFLSLMLDPVAGNMVRTSFLSKTAAPKRAEARLGKPLLAVRRALIDPALESLARLACFERVDDPRDAEVAFVRDAKLVHACAIAVREVCSDSPSASAVELRYAGELDRCEAVEIAGQAGEVAARAVAAATRMRLLAIAVDNAQPGPLERMLEVVRRWSAVHAQTAARRGALAVAVDAAALFRSARLDVGASPVPDADARAAGLALLYAVASEAAACLASGLVAGSQDIDVLAVFGAGFPAWSGGPLSFLDMVRRGEFTQFAPPSAAPLRAFYAD